MAKRKPLPTLEELKSMGWKKYITSTYWRKYRLSLLGKDDATCEICGKKRWGFYAVGKRKGMRKPKPSCQFHLHHKTYNHLGEEVRDNIMLLCKPCHSLAHDLEVMARTRKGVYETMYNLLITNTGWSYEKFKK